MVLRSTLLALLVALAAAPALLAAPAPKPHLVYAADGHFPPYDYLDANGKPTGFNVELVRALARDAGAEVEFRLEAWDRARADIDAGRADVISLSYSTERARDYLWLGQTWSMSQCVMFRPGRATYPHGPNELGGETIAVQERSAVGELLFGLPPPRPVLVVVDTQEEALRTLDRGAASGVGGNSLTLRRAAAITGLHDLVEVPLRAVPYGLMAKRGRELELEWVARSLGRVRDAGTIEALAEKFLAAPVSERTWRDYEIDGLVFLGAVLAFWGAASLWNRSLRRKVRRRTQALETALRQKDELARSLAASDHRYRTFLDLTSEAIARLELDEPVAVDRPPAEQVGHIVRTARLAECNRAFVRIAGAPEGEPLTGLLLTDLVPAAEMAERVQAFVAGGYNLAANESRRVLRDGNAAWVSTSAVGVLEDGFLKAIWFSEQEITGRRLAEDALRESEKKYRDIFEFAPLGIYQARRDGSLITANGAFAELLGYDRVEETLGLLLSRDVYFDPAERDRLIARYEKVGHGANVELLLKRRDSAPFWGEMTSHAVKDESGQTLYFESFVQDISTRKAAEEALRASEERYRLLFEGNPLPMLVCDADTLGLLAVNDAAVDQYGYTREELLELAFADLTIPDEDREPEAGNEPSSPHDVFHAGLRRGRRKDGSVLDIDLTSLIIPFAGHLARMVVARNVTAERRIAAEREGLQAALRHSETMSAMGSLVAGVAHEVRNPLFSISATVDAFDSELGDAHPYGEYTNLLRSQVARLTQLTSDLLDYGKPRALKPTAVHPRDLVRRAIRACAVLARQHDVKVTDDVSADLPQLELDAGRMEQVLENLIANAIHHSPPGGCVRATARLVEDREVELLVEDEGEGVALPDLPKLFEPFFSRRRGGTGLGLSLVQRIVEAHGGRVVAANRAQGGAVFTVKLAVRR
jgi:PAS domain S-box-containing protein